MSDLKLIRCESCRQNIISKSHFLKVGEDLKLSRCQFLAHCHGGPTRPPTFLSSFPFLTLAHLDDLTRRPFTFPSECRECVPSVSRPCLRCSSNMSSHAGMERTPRWHAGRPVPGRKKKGPGCPRSCDLLRLTTRLLLAEDRMRSDTPGWSCQTATLRPLYPRTTGASSRTTEDRPNRHLSAHPGPALRPMPPPPTRGAHSTSMPALI